jgi:hypothetical protein
MVLTTRQVTQPQMVFISKEQLNITRERLMVAADLVAEVGSRESRRQDRIDRRDLFQAAAALL